MEINRQTKVIVTGASRGIGKALVRELVEKGASVLGIARSEDALRSLAGELPGNRGKFNLLPIDLSDNQGRNRLISWVKKNWKKFDILVNNAGILYSEKVTRSNMAKVREIMEVNFFAPLELIVKLSPMIFQSGMVVNILSPAIYRNHPDAGFYAASKSALRNVTSALRRGERGKVKVLGYYPGFVKTGIFRKREDLPLLLRLLMVSPEFTARTIVHQIETGEEGEYYEPVAWMIKFVGLFGF